jgi:hypothetical protein
MHHPKVAAASIRRSGGREEQLSLSIALVRSSSRVGQSNYRSFIFVLPYSISDSCDGQVDRCVVAETDEWSPPVSHAIQMQRHKLVIVESSKAVLASNVLLISG